MSQKGSAQWVLEADIKGCFDHIDHDWLEPVMSQWIAAILRKWLKAGLIYQGQLQVTEAGTPQGGHHLPDVGQCDAERVGARTDRGTLVGRLGIAKTKKLKVHVVRYADDFVITGDSQEVLVSEV